jgi:hypothetical protein
MNLGWLGQRGPPPTLADSEVIIMEVVGAFAGLQEANLWVIRQRRRWWNQLPRPGAGWGTAFPRISASVSVHDGVVSFAEQPFTATMRGCLRRFMANLSIAPKGTLRSESAQGGSGCPGAGQCGAIPIQSPPWIVLLPSLVVLLNHITPVQSVARPPSLTRTATARGPDCPPGGGALPERQYVGRAATNRHDGAPRQGRRTRLLHRRANAR